MPYRSFCLTMKSKAAVRHRPKHMLLKQREHDAGKITICAAQPGGGTEITMKTMINITDSSADIERYRDGMDAFDLARRFGCNGLELMHLADGKEDFFLPDSVMGVHLRFFSDWLDLWRGDMEALRAEYDTLDQAKEVFGGLDRSCILKPLKEDLELAKRLGAEYVVFHVSNVRDSEVFTYQFSHTDEEVIDASAELINELLDGRDYRFSFLMENLWWPGLTMTRPEMTRRLLDQIHYPKKGIMLDTGHLMHTNLELQTEEEAIAYILEKVKEHGDLSAYIRGIHLNQSLTGDYVKKLLKKKDAIPQTYQERLGACYEHVFRIDRHLPFTTPEVQRILDEIQPEYLTHELITRDRKEHEAKLRQQVGVLAER